MPAEQEVNAALYQLAGRCVLDYQYEMALKCLLAVLQNDPVPDDFAQCSLDVARIYIEHTDEMQKAQETLLQLVRSSRFALVAPAAWPRAQHKCWFNSLC